MSATPEYIAQLEAHAKSLRETNTRIADEWLKSMTNGQDIDNTEVGALMRANRAEADRYQAQAQWHRHDNGEPVVSWPKEKPWRD